MKKIWIALLFILFSVALFLTMWLIFTHFFISSNTDPFSELGEALSRFPYMVAIFSILLVLIAWWGMTFSRKKGYTEVYKGFIISLIYSVILMIVMAGMLIYSYSQ